MAYVRTVKTASGAIAVQIVHPSRCRSRNIALVWLGNKITHRTPLDTWAAPVKKS